MFAYRTSGKVLRKVRCVVTFCQWYFSSPLQLAPCPVPLAPRQTQPVAWRNLLRPASGTALPALRKPNITICGHPADQSGARVNPGRRRLALTTSPFGLVHILTSAHSDLRRPDSQHRAKQCAGWLSWSFSGDLARKSRSVCHCYGALLSWRGDR